PPVSASHYKSGYSIGVRLTTMNKTTASRAVLVFACCIFAGFFMPWIQVLGFATSGYDLGNLGSYGNYAWIVPLLSATTIIVSLFGIDNRPIGLATGAILLAFIGYGILHLTAEGGG